jgi:hypothetical protein
MSKRARDPGARRCITRRGGGRRSCAEDVRLFRDQFERFLRGMSRRSADPARVPHCSRVGLLVVSGRDGYTGCTIFQVR